MAGPLSGVGAQQQVPISNTFQPGGQNNTPVREREEAQPQENTVQPQGAAAAESQNTETNNQGDILNARVAENVGGSDNTQQSDQPRGSVIDITV